jgi:hypothetical protein
MAAKAIKDTRRLMHKLSADEKEEMTANLTEQLIQIDQLNDEKKEVAASFKRRIDNLHEQNSRLAHWLNAGEREQDIAVEIRMNYPRNGIKTITRMDTFEAWEEPMPESEQNLMNLRAAEVE